MDRKFAGIVGALSVATVVNSAEAVAAPELEQAMSASSYSELLRPIPNAVVLLKIADELNSQPNEPAKTGEQVAQFWGGPFFHHHHHHHHHNNYWRRRYYHHHHHHHHNNYYRRYYNGE